MSIEAMYQERADRFGQQEAGWARQDGWLAHLRVAAFALAALLLAVAWMGGGDRLWYLPGGFALAAFVILVGYHERVIRLRTTCGELRRINEQALARLHRRWDDFPVPDVAVAASDQALAQDLDLFGKASLFQLVCTAGTSLGRETIRDWLLQPVSIETAQKRQQAARELVAHVELRERLQLEGRMLIGRTAGPIRFTQWADGEPWLARRPALQWTVRLLPLALLSVLVLIVTGWIPAEPGGLIFTALVLVNAAISVCFTGSAHDIFDMVSTRKSELSRYRAMFTLLYSMPDTTSQLAAIRHELTERGGGVLQRLSSLQRIMRLANIRHSPMLFILCYVPLQLLTLWDFQVLGWLQHWQLLYGRHVPAWFAALGQFEALASWATLAHDHPTWVFADLTADGDQLLADGLGHPLLPAGVRVGNDVQLGPPGTFLLVTGSNMSGKSTLLRSIGTNVLLAQAGAPVSARRMQLPPVQVATSMRIHDSLQDGVSFFMAELRRLKEIVDAAHDNTGRRDRRFLYLLDEILQGTNSRERHIAVVRVLAHLLECGSIGAVSTHDLELATSPPIDASCRAVHFRETLHDESSERPMTFDYKLRPGVATSTNALRLLQIVGLDDPSDSPQRSDGV